MQKFVRYMKKHWIAHLMILPFFIGLCVFSVYPPVRGLLISFFNVDKVTDKLTVFVGFSNYKDLFQDSIFLNSIRTVFTLQLPRFIVNCSVPFLYGELVFLIASKKMQSVYRMLLLLPIVCPGIIVSLIWTNIYAYDGGILNEILTRLGIVGENVNFLGTDHIVGSLIFMGFPWLPGTTGLIVISGLINIPGEVLEATKLDGCSTLRRIFVIDLSYLIGQIKYVVVFGVIGIFQDYSNQLLFADRVGTAIHVPAYYMYQLVQINQSIGKASAIGVVLFVVIMLITLATYRFLNGRDEENV